MQFPRSILLLAPMILIGLTDCSASHVSTVPAASNMPPALRTISELSGARESTPLLYVANFLTFTVTAYPFDANGNVVPMRTIAGQHTGLNRSVGVALDASRNLYVVNSAFPESITVYAPGANGDAAPIRTITGAKTGLVQPEWIALDRGGRIYVSVIGPPPLGSNGSIRVFAPGADGNVAPLRVIAGAHTRILSPAGLVLDGHEDIIVASGSVSNPSVSSVLTFRPSAKDDASPVHVLQGDETSLSGAIGIALNRTNDDLYVADSGSGAVTAYAASANGDVPPVATIRGSATGLIDTSVNGVLFDRASELYVSKRFVNPFQDRIEIFTAGATGNVSPIRTITGPATQLFGPAGMAIDG